MLATPVLSLTVLSGAGVGGRDKEPGRVVALLPMVAFEIGLRVNCCLFQTKNHVLLILGYP